MSRDVLCLSHLRWGFVYQRPNHLMSRCARSRRVFFVEEPIFEGSSRRLDVSVNQGVHVVVPHLPLGTPPALAEQAQRLMVDGLVERAHIREPLLWFYTPMALGYARDVHACAVVYDCMDELSLFRGAPAALVARERELFEIADIVFTGGQSLFEAKRGLHPNVFAFPSSVDAAHFEQAQDRNLAQPPDQRDLSHPRLGFFGVIDERLDVDLLAKVADLRPDLSIVMIGPVVKIDPAELPRRPNIHWLGARQYRELPAYLAGWDVAIMPFARNEATRFISPTKTLEYLAAGRPIVSTSIRDVVRPYGEQGLVAIADDPGAFVAAVDAALAARGTAKEAELQLARDALLAQTSWDKTAERMSVLVREAVARRRSAEWRSERTEEAPCSTI